MHTSRLAPLTTARRRFLAHILRDPQASFEAHQRGPSIAVPVSFLSNP